MLALILFALPVLVSSQTQTACLQCAQTFDTCFKATPSNSHLCRDSYSKCVGLCSWKKNEAIACPGCISDF